MNRDVIKGNWEQMKGKIKELWGKLTDNDITEINGKREQLLAKLKTAYGWEHEHAEEELRKLEDSMKHVDNCCCDECAKSDTDTDVDETPKSSNEDRNINANQTDIQQPEPNAPSSEDHDIDRNEGDFGKRKTG